jgi:2-iminobutanoate/2-iminopropanoate deaminase
MLQRITSSPDPYEPFLLFQGIRLGDLLLISGQAGEDADRRIVRGGFKAQG